MHPQRSTYNRIAALGTLLLVLGWTSACATKKYVTRNVMEPLKAKIGGVDKRVDEADNRITDLDRKTEQGISNAHSVADKAGQQAAKAETDAQLAQTLANKGINQANQLQQEVESLDNYQPATSATVLFDFDRATLTDEQIQKLDALVQNVTSMKHYVIEVEGFTDKTGPPAYNLELSRRRAEEVTRYLTAHNIPLARIHELGYGSQPPVSPETSDKRMLRKLSRRVEVKVLTPPTTQAAAQASQSSSPAQTTARREPVSNE